MQANVLRTLNKLIILEIEMLIIKLKINLIIQKL